MSEREDMQVLDYLYGELSDEDGQAFEHAMQADADLGAQVDDYADVLETMRTLDDEEPSSHLDALILATARASVEQDTPSPWFKRLFGTPWLNVALGGACALVLAVTVGPTLNRSSLEPEVAPGLRSVPATTREAKFAQDEDGARPSASSAALPVEARDDDADGVASEKQANGPKPDVESARRGRAAPVPAGAPAVAARPRTARSPSLLGGKDRAPEVGASSGAGGRGRGSGVKGALEPTSEAPRRRRRMARKVAKKKRARPVTRSMDEAEMPMDSVAESLDSGRGDELFDLKTDDLEDSSNVGRSRESVAKRASPPSSPPAPPAPPAVREESASTRAPVAVSASETSKESLAQPRKASAKAAPTDDRVGVRKEAVARELARRVHKKARERLARNDMDGARALYRDARSRTVGTLAYFELTLRLAELEYQSGKFAQAQKLAQQAVRSRDQGVRRAARRLVARSRRVRVDEGVEADARDLY